MSRAALAAAWLSLAAACLSLAACGVKAPPRPPPPAAAREAAMRGGPHDLGPRDGGAPCDAGTDGGPCDR